MLPLSSLSSPFCPSSFILESAYPTSNGTSVKIDTLNVHERNTCIFTELGLFFALKYLNVRKTQTSTSDDATSANVALIPFFVMKMRPCVCVRVSVVRFMRAQVKFMEAIFLLFFPSLGSFFWGKRKIGNFTHHKRAKLCSRRRRQQRSSPPPSSARAATPTEFSVLDDRAARRRAALFLLLFLRVRMKSKKREEALLLLERVIQTTRTRGRREARREVGTSGFPEVRF